jgi:hypothetical protein
LSNYSTQEWFKASIEDTFPMFKEWKKRREDEKGENSEIPDRNIAWRNTIFDFIILELK